MFWVLLMILLLVVATISIYITIKSKSKVLGVIVTTVAIVSTLLITIPVAINDAKLDVKYNEYIELIDKNYNRDQLSDLEQLELDLEIRDYNMWLSFNEPYLENPFSFMSINNHKFDYIY